MAKLLGYFVLYFYSQVFCYSEGLVNPDNDKVVDIVWIRYYIKRLKGNLRNIQVVVIVVTGLNQERLPSSWIKVAQVLCIFNLK